MRQKYMDDMNKTHIQSVKEKSQLVRKMQIIHEEGGRGGGALVWDRKLGVAVGYMIWKCNV